MEDAKITNGNRCQVTPACMYPPGHTQECQTRQALKAEETKAAVVEQVNENSDTRQATRQAKREVRRERRNDTI